MGTQWPYLTQPPILLPCCQLLAGLNALRFFGIRSPEPGDEAFDYLVDLAQCRNQGALNIGQAWGSLGLLVERGPHTLSWIKQRVRSGLPVAVTGDFSVGVPHMGLVVDTRKDWLYIVNWANDETISTIKFEEIKLVPQYVDAAYAFSYPGYTEAWW